MNLEIADIAGALYSAAQVTLALAEADAPDDLSLALGNCQSPARALEAIECEEIRSAVHAQLNGARHRARRRECDQRIIVRRLCVPNRERCARPHARGRKRVARLQQSGGHLFHHAAGYESSLQAAPVTLDRRAPCVGIFTDRRAKCSRHLCVPDKIPEAKAGVRPRDPKYLRKEIIDLLLVEPFADVG